jgi:hypothetical protein
LTSFINRNGSYLFLKSERNASDWTLLNALHKVGGETGNLVSKSLGLDDCNVVDDSLIYMEVAGKPAQTMLETR